MNIELIKWVDSNLRSSAWATLEDFDSNITPIQSVGFVLKETDDYVALVANVGFETDTTAYQGSGIITIPKVCITERTVLSAELKVVEAKTKTDLVYNKITMSSGLAKQALSVSVKELFDWCNAILPACVKVEGNTVYVRDSGDWSEVKYTNWIMFGGSNDFFSVITDEHFLLNYEHILTNN